jgi:enamine deaminase RidA (YjgF/YER057c/UK114 family)
MSHLRYAAYSKHGEGAKDLANMSQSARYPLSGEVITISGQGGWDRENSKVAEDLKEEYDRVSIIRNSNLSAAHSYLNSLTMYLPGL